MVNNHAHVDTAFFTQNDACNNILQFGTPYAEHLYNNQGQFGSHICLTWETLNGKRIKIFPHNQLSNRPAFMVFVWCVSLVEDTKILAIN